MCYINHKNCWKIFNLFTIIGTIAVLIIGVISMRNSLSIKINQIGSWKGEQLIAHAGGSIDGISYTNSLKTGLNFSKSNTSFPIK